MVSSPEILEENVGEDRIRDLCDEVFKEDFEIFIETGEASEGLLDHIESCKRCVAETERCSDELAKKFDKLREVLKTKHSA